MVFVHTAGGVVISQCGISSVGVSWCLVDVLLYLISKCVLAIGRNRVTWRSINLASALRTHYCLHGC